MPFLGHSRFMAVAAAAAGGGTTPSGTAVNPTSVISTGSGNVWTNPNNALTLDGSYATSFTVVSGLGTQLLQFSFGALIPSNATPTGFLVTVRGQDTGLPNFSASLHMSVNLGGTTTIATGTNFPTSPGTVTFGSTTTFPTNGSYTAANINGMLLNVYLTGPQVSPGPGYQNNVGIDFVTVAVTYH